jgi:hypothetical protein
VKIKSHGVHCKPATATYFVWVINVLCRLKLLVLAFMPRYHVQGTQSSSPSALLEFCHGMGAAQLGNVAGLTGQCHPWAGSCKVANTPVMALPMPPGNLRLQIQTSNQYAYYVFVPIGTREGTRRDPVFLKKKGYQYEDLHARHRCQQLICRWCAT